MQISKVLQTKGSDVATAQPSTPVLDAAATLKTKGIGAIVVLGGDGRIAGILSERDIVHALADHGGVLNDLTVGDLMTRDVTTCRANQDVNHVMRTMTQHRFRHLPVVDNAGKLIGIISIGDAVKARIEELEYETEALQNIIAS